MKSASIIRGRGSSGNIANRFAKLHFEEEKEDGFEENSSFPQTQILKDTSKSLITYNNSPDVGFNASINVYRGCEHGCIYCYARPTHEYLGFSSGLDFESKIMVKENAPFLLRKELSSKKWKPQVLAMSGVTDCYQPIERKLKLTRQCLEVLAEFRNPVVIITKNFLVTRDIDVLKELARFDCVRVYISLTSLDDELRKKLEPRTSPAHRRLEAIRGLAEAKIPVGTLIAPIIPALNDHEIPKLLESASQAGASSAHWVLVRLPYGVAPLFESWLEKYFPDRKEKVLNRIKEIRGGKINEPNFGARMRGQGVFADEINDLFKIAAKKFGLDREIKKLSSAYFRTLVNKEKQLSLF